MKSRDDKDNYKQIAVVFPRAWWETQQKKAEGLSINQFIRRCIEEYTGSINQPQYTKTIEALNSKIDLLSNKSSEYTKKIDDIDTKLSLIMKLLAK